MKPTSLRPKEKQTMTLDQVNEELRKKTAKRGILLKTIGLIEKIKVDIAGPLWQHISIKMGGMLAGVDQLDDRADEYDPQAHPIPDRVIWKAHGIRKAAKAILAIENMVENEQGYKDSLEKVEKEIKDLGARKQQLG